MTNTINEFDNDAKAQVVSMANDDERDKLISQGRTAFIGSVMEREDDKYSHQLFLITYSTVVLASDPSYTWNDNTKFIVERWVDIEINILN